MPPVALTGLRGWVPHKGTHPRLERQFARCLTAETRLEVGLCLVG